MTMKPRAIDLVDVFVYTVVLALFVEFFPQVLSESFVLTVLTAVLLKLVLEAVLWVKNRVKKRVKTSTGWQRLGSVLMLVLVLPGSKFLVLELTAWVFRGQVYLGSFWQVTALIVTLMLARASVRRLLTGSALSSERQAD